MITQYTKEQPVPFKYFEPILNALSSLPDAEGESGSNNQDKESE